MSPEQFAYWLQGYAELTDTAPSAEQWKCIQDHLALVFTKVTPPIKWPGATPFAPYWHPHGAGAVTPNGTQVLC